MNEYEQSSSPCNGDGNIDRKIELPPPLAELLLLQEAEQEIPVEDIMARAIKNYMKGHEHNAC